MTLTLLFRPRSQTGDTTDLTPMVCDSFAAAAALIDAMAASGMVCVAITLASNVFDAIYPSSTTYPSSATFPSPGSIIPGNPSASSTDAFTLTPA